jgi:tRNA-modifying protein YgfZ
MAHLPRMGKIAHLPHRAVLTVTGADRVTFLNGLVSNDVALAAPGTAVWAALLTPQGKYLADFFILATADSLFLDCQANQRDMLAQKLTRHRLRANVAIAPTDHAVHAAWGEPPAPPAAAVAAPDPRLPSAGWRVLTTTPLTANATAQDYTHHRLTLGLPDGTSDMEPDKSVLLEGGFDELAGISWTKGCYLGQELTARTRYRGLLKRRLLPVSAEAPLPAPGTPILAGTRDVGVLRSVLGTKGLALLRLDALDGNLSADGVALSVRVPAWVHLPADTAA